MNVDDVRKELETLEKKYWDLVWYARTSPSCLHDDHISMPGVVRIRMNMPDECNKLAGDQSEWQHGFNSGCLAAFRLALGLMSRKQSEREFAKDSFPFLDT